MPIRSMMHGLVFSATALAIYLAVGAGILLWAWDTLVVALFAAPRLTYEQTLAGLAALTVLAALWRFGARGRAHSPVDER